MISRGAPDDPAEIQPQLWAGASGRLAFDVGANTGQSVERMLSAGFSEVYAFEPAIESYEVLVSRYATDGRVVCSQTALAEYEGKLNTAVMEHPIASGQLVHKRADHGAHVPAGAWGRVLGHRRVYCAPLDSYTDIAGQPDFVKIDTEGHEYQVLLGAPRTIAAGTRFLIEFHDDTLHDGCAELLRDAGYHVQTVRHPAHPPGSYMHTRHGWIKASREN